MILFCILYVLNVQTTSPRADKLGLIILPFFQYEPTTTKRTMPTLVTGLGPENKKPHLTEVEEAKHADETHYEDTTNSDAAEDRQSEYSITATGVEEYIPKSLTTIEKIIENDIKTATELPSPIFPPTPESLDEFDFSKVMNEITNPSRFLSDVLPVKEGYEGVKVTKVQKMPEQVKSIADHNIATELIYKECAYWGQYKRLLRNLEKGQSKKEISCYDGVNVHAYKDKRGRMYATRLYKTVEILGNVRDTNKEAAYTARVIWSIPEEVNPKKIPTAFIPPDSPYYAKLLTDMIFPETGHWWYHRKAEDKVWVHFRADSKRYIHAHRNGVTVELFISGRKINSTNARKIVNP